MPALSVIDNTPRDCPSPFCGAEADTSILNPAEAATMPLGRNSKGAVVAATMMNAFMGGAGKNNNHILHPRIIVIVLRKQWKLLHIRRAKTNPVILPSFLFESNTF